MSASTFDQSGFEYYQPLWGNLIYGTKAQLQTIGIAVGMDFPGEPDGPKRVLRVLDPRGFPTRIEQATHQGVGLFSASISFPGREHTPEQWTDFAAGVRKHEHPCFDEYVGTAHALTVAGVVRLDQFPGQPGMRKVRVTILPDGRPVTGKTSNPSEAKDPGAKQIERASNGIYTVRVKISIDEQQRRLDKRQYQERAWEARMRALPRPAPLIALSPGQKPARRSSHLRCISGGRQTTSDNEAMTSRVSACQRDGNVVFLPEGGGENGVSR